MSTFTSANKNCATCAHWGGPRTLEQSSFVKADFMAKGKCAFGRINAFAGPSSTDGANCDKYQKWSALK